MLAGNAEKLRNLGLGFVGRRNHVLPQQRAGMGRTAIRIALRDMSHDLLYSTLLTVTRIRGIANRRAPRQTPKQFRAEPCLGCRDARSSARSVRASR